LLKLHNEFMTQFASSGPQGMGRKVNDSPKHSEAGSVRQFGYRNI
jgi:hypothetical protein